MCLLIEAHWVYAACLVCLVDSMSAAAGVPGVLAVPGVMFEPCPPAVMTAVVF